MKKKITPLTFLLCSALLAAGCSKEDVKVKKENGNYVIYSITVDGKKQSFTADDLLDEMLDSQVATTRLYNEVSRKVFALAADQKLSSSRISEIKKVAEDKVTDFKANVKSQSKEQGIDYDTYLESSLEQEGVKTLDELEKLYVDQEKKSAYLEDYVEDNYDYFLEKYLSVYTPFQVKHILVAANTADSQFTNGTMTPDKARLLLKVIRRFMTGEKFATIADLTDDTSSKDNGGIMPFNQGQNYVNEFRFAPYILALNEKTGDERLKLAQQLHLIDDELDLADAGDKAKAQEDYDELRIDSVYENGVGTIKLTDILELEKEVTKDDKGANFYYDAEGNRITSIDTPTYAEQVYELPKGVQEGDEEYYEEYELKRNVIFNNTLNTHQVKYISVDGVADVAENAKATVKVNGVNTDVLADDQGNPIYVIYASTGIHFMVNVYDYIKEVNAEGGLEKVKSFFTLFDSSSKDTDYTKYQNTYIGQNEAYLKRDKLESNSDTLLAAVQSYISPLEEYAFNELVYVDQEITIQFRSEELYENVQKYVEDRIEAGDDSFYDALETSFDTYISKLERELEAKQALVTE